MQPILALSSTSEDPCFDGVIVQTGRFQDFPLPYFAQRDKGTLVEALELASGFSIYISYSTETWTTPLAIMPRARAAPIGQLRGHE
jgi:hypothetical protein